MDTVSVSVQTNINAKYTVFRSAIDAYVKTVGKSGVVISQAYSHLEEQKNGLLILLDQLSKLRGISTITKEKVQEDFNEAKKRFIEIIEKKNNQTACMAPTKYQNVKIRL